MLFDSTRVGWRVLGRRVVKKGCEGRLWREGCEGGVKCMEKYWFTRIQSKSINLCAKTMVFKQSGWNFSKKTGFNATWVIVWKSIGFTGIPKKLVNFCGKSLDFRQNGVTCLKSTCFTRTVKVGQFSWNVIGFLNRIVDFEGWRRGGNGQTERQLKVWEVREVSCCLEGLGPEGRGEGVGEVVGAQVGRRIIEKISDHLTLTRRIDRRCTRRTRSICNILSQTECRLSR